MSKIKILIAPDSFKETMSSKEVSDIIKCHLLEKNPNYLIDCIPMADGGEGTVESILSSLGGTKINKIVTGPNFEKVESFYAIVSDYAVIEVASVVGFNNKKTNSNPGNTTTYGIGELIIDAYNRGLKKIYIGLGGSITNDAGAGLLSAIGIDFFNKHDEKIIPTGNMLHEIIRVNSQNLKIDLNKVEIIVLCDVNNPLFGLNGASFVYAKQKGANEEMIKQLDNELVYYDKIINDNSNSVYSILEGAGAAGGIGYSLMRFLNAKMVSGIEQIKLLTNFDERIKDCDYVITGEGKLDSQSLNGKLISGIIDSSKKYGVKVIGIVGKIDGDKKSFLKQGLHQLYETNYRNLPFTEVKKTCREDLKEILNNINL